MEQKLISTENAVQFSKRTLKQMATQGIGHSNIMKIVDNLSGKDSTKKSESKSTKKKKSKTKTKKKTKTKRRTKKQKIADAKKGKYVNPLTNRKCSYKYALKKGFITELGEKIPLKDMKFENPETGRMVSYQYAKRKGLI